MPVLSAVIRESTALSPAKWVPIAIGVVLVAILAASGLRAAIVRGWVPFGRRWRVGRDSSPPGPDGQPTGPSARHALRLAACCSGPRHSVDGGGGPAPPPSPVKSPEMKAVRDALVDSTARACPVEAPLRNCAVCMNPLSMDLVGRGGGRDGGGGEVPRQAGDALPWVSTLRCGHDFHTACVTRWAAREGEATACPVCRVGLVGADVTEATKPNGAREDKEVGAAHGEGLADGEGGGGGAPRS